MVSLVEWLFLVWLLYQCAWCGGGARTQVEVCLVSLLSVNDAQKN